MLKSVEINCALVLYEVRSSRWTISLIQNDIPTLRIFVNSSTEAEIVSISQPLFLDFEKINPDRTIFPIIVPQMKKICNKRLKVSIMLFFNQNNYQLILHQFWWNSIIILILLPIQSQIFFQFSINSSLSSHMIRNRQRLFYGSK